MLSAFFGGLRCCSPLWGAFVMSYAVSRRRTEIGIRMAFGGRLRARYDSSSSDAALVGLGIAAGTVSPSGRRSSWRIVTIYGLHAHPITLSRGPRPRDVAPRRDTYGATRVAHRSRARSREKARRQRDLPAGQPFDGSHTRILRGPFCRDSSPACASACPAARASGISCYCLLKDTRSRSSDGVNS